MVTHEQERHNTISRADLLREADYLSNNSNNSSRSTHRLSQASAAATAEQQQRKESSGSNSSSVAHHARPRTLSAQQLRQRSTVGYDEGRLNGVPHEVTFYWVNLVLSTVTLWGFAECVLHSPLQQYAWRGKA